MVSEGRGVLRAKERYMLLPLQASTLLRGLTGRLKVDYHVQISTGTDDRYGPDLPPIGLLAMLCLLVPTSWCIDLIVPLRVH